MKKLFKVLTAMIIVSITLQCISIGVSAKKLERMPKDLEPDIAFNIAISSNEFLDITIVGNSIENLPDVGFKFKKVQQLEQVNSDSQYKSIWITPEAYKTLLEDSGKLEELDNYMNDGYTIYFLGLEDINILSEKFTGTSPNDVVVSGDKQVVSYMSKNQNGEYFFGHFFSKKNYNDKKLVKLLIASAWNRRNDLHYTRENQSSDFSELLTTKVKAADGADFSIGSGWKCRFGWNQYNFSTDWGDYTEWKAGFYLKSTVDGKNYYALGMENCMAPTGALGGSSDYLRIKCDLKLNKAGQLLYNYAPKSSPSTNTFSFSIGGGLNKDGASGLINAKWDVTYSDLELLDSSTPSSQVMDIKFNYKWPWGNFTTYSKHTSWQNSSIICQGASGSTSAIISNLRIAQFASYLPDSLATDSNSLNLNSTITNA